MHAETRVVQIDVIATDSRGKPVVDLSKDDFSLSIEGKPRTIDIFSVNRGQPEPVAAANPPLPSDTFSNRGSSPPNISGHSTVIVMDELNSSHDPWRTPFQTAAANTLQVISLMNKVPPDERIALYVMAKNIGLEILQDYTTDRKTLVEVMKKYIPRGMTKVPDPLPQSARAAALPGSPRRDPNAGSLREAAASEEDASGDTRLSLEALAEHLALVPGRKNVFLVRGGAGGLLMHGTWTSAWDKTLEALNEANVAVNTVGEIATRTGGQTWAGRNDLDQALAEEIESTRTTYTLGFYLTERERDDEFHALKVEANRRGLELFYRLGFYAGNSDLRSSYKKTAKGEMETVLLNQVNATGIGITAKVVPAPGIPRGKLDIRLNLDPASLSLTEMPGGWKGKVTETVVEQSSTGNTLSKISDTREFKVTNPDRATYNRQGVTWPLSIPAMESATKLTIIVRDEKTGYLGSLTIPLK
jgi:VWFA-related protein